MCAKVLRDTAIELAESHYRKIHAGHIELTTKRELNAYAGKLATMIRTLWNEPDSGLQSLYVEMNVRNRAQLRNGTSSELTGRAMTALMVIARFRGIDSGAWPDAGFKACIEAGLIRPEIAAKYLGGIPA